MVRGEKLRNGLGWFGRSPKKNQKWSGMVWEVGGGGGGGQGAPAKCFGLRVFTDDAQRLDRLDGQCGPYLALERPAAPTLPRLHVQCSHVAREARTASGSQVLVANTQQDFRV